MGKEMTPKEKAEELVDYFKTLVYPFIGSSMLTNDEDEGVILSNSKTCALKVVDEVQQTETLENRYCGYLPIEKNHKEYWELVKAEIENL